MEHILEFKRFENKYKNLWGGVNLKDINPYDFEELIAHFFSSYLNVDVQVTQKSQDHGIDAYVKENSEYKMIFQVKKYKKTNKVGEPVIRDLYGVMASYALTQKIGMPKGVIITTGDYSPSAIAWAQGKNVILINGIKLVELFHKKGYSNFYLDFYETPEKIKKKFHEIINKKVNTPKNLIHTVQQEKKNSENSYQHQRLIKIKESKVSEEVLREAELKRRRYFEKRRIQQEQIQTAQKTTLKMDREVKEEIVEPTRKQYDEQKQLKFPTKEIIHNETHQQITESDKTLKKHKKERAEKRQKVRQAKELRYQDKLIKEKKFQDMYGHTYSQIIALNILKVCGWSLLSIVPMCIAGNNFKYNYLVALYIDCALLVHILLKYIMFKRGKNIFEDFSCGAVCIKGALGFFVWIITLACSWQLSIMYISLVFINYFVLHRLLNK